MELKVTQKLNDKQTVDIIFEGENLEKVLLQATPVLEFNGKCEFCSSENIILHARKTKTGDVYLEFVCKDCGATRPFGKYKDGSGYFLKSWQPKYVAGENQTA